MANYRRIAPALREKGTLVLCEDERWIEKGMEEFVATPGYTARWNCFLSMDVATRRIIWNPFPRRRNMEFRLRSQFLADVYRRRLS